MSCHTTSPSNMTVTYLSDCWQDSTLRTQQCWKLKWSISLSIFTPELLILIGDMTTDLFWCLKSYIDSNPNPPPHFHCCFSLCPHLSPKWGANLMMIPYPESYLCINLFYWRWSAGNTNTTTLHYLNPSVSPHHIKWKSRFLKIVLRLSSRS